MKKSIIIPATIAIVLASSILMKASAKTNALKNLKFKFNKFKFNLAKSASSILTGKLAFDVNLSLINTQSESLNVSDIFLKLFLNGSSIATLTHDVVNIPSQKSLNITPTIYVDITKLPSIISKIYTATKTSLQSSTDSNKTLIIINAIAEIKNQLDQLKGNLSVDGNLKVENVPFEFKQKIAF